jgi:hypothetical protein
MPNVRSAPSSEHQLDSVRLMGQETRTLSLLERLRALRKLKKVARSEGLQAVFWIQYSSTMDSTDGRFFSPTRYYVGLLAIRLDEKKLRPVRHDSSRNFKRRTLNTSLLWVTQLHKLFLEREKGLRGFVWDRRADQIWSQTTLLSCQRFIQPRLFDLLTTSLTLLKISRSSFVLFQLDGSRQSTVRYLIPIKPSTS